MSDNFANNSNMTALMTAIGNKIKAAGHTIYNAAGTALTRRSKLKFTGRMKVTDDSTNGQTVVDDSPEHIDWDDWCAMTEQQQAAVKEAVIDNAPGVDGGLTANLMTKLWENPDPSQLFAAQDITLSSSDYDFLLTLYITTNTITATSNGVGHSVIVKKGSSISLDCVLPYGGMPAANYYRPMVRNSNTSYSVGACRIGGISASGSVSFVDSNTSSCIPIAIYGIKQTINLKFSAIASDISTAADHCMMSDGVTNVEDILDARTRVIDLSPYLGSNFSAHGSNQAIFISDKVVAISINAVVSSISKTSDILFENLPFAFTNLTVSYIFPDPSQFPNNPVYNDATHGLLFTSGRNLLCHHDVITIPSYGFIVARIV